MESMPVHGRATAKKGRRLGPVKATPGAIARAGLEGVPFDSAWWTHIGPNDAKIMINDIKNYLGCTIAEAKLACVLVCWMQMPEAARQGMPGFYAAAIAKEATKGC
jgi:hypothetical protein